jgi:hypothetical protein
MTKANTPEARQVSEDRLIWEGITLRIAYEANWLGLADTAHIEVHVVEPEGAPLPITETGYRSHFVDRHFVEECGGALAYVRSWLEEAALSPEWKKLRERRRQLSLF